MSPFKSKAQAKFMYAVKPELAHEFAEKTRSIKALPERKRKKMAKEMPAMPVMPRSVHSNA